MFSFKMAISMAATVIAGSIGMAAACTPQQATKTELDAAKAAACVGEELISGNRNVVKILGNCAAQGVSGLTQDGVASLIGEFDKVRMSTPFPGCPTSVVSDAGAKE